MQRYQLNYYTPESLKSDVDRANLLSLKLIKAKVLIGASLLLALGSLGLVGCDDSPIKSKEKPRYHEREERYDENRS